MFEDERCAVVDPPTRRSPEARLSSTSGTKELFERTPLLADGRKCSWEDTLKVPRTLKAPRPLPKSQIAALLFLQLSEPVTSQSIYPFINELIKNLDVTGHDDPKAGYYAGLLESLFFACEAMTVLFWSRLSDIVGRRPILFVGFTGLSLSMISFGLARSFSGLIFSRCLAGLLNGYSGVIKTMLGELTGPTNMAQAFAFIPVVWSAGAMIGPFIGGELSHPAERFPIFFGRSRFWETHPYFLPCLIAGMFPLTSLAVILPLLKENSEEIIEDVEVSGSAESQYTDLDVFEVSPPLKSILTRPVLIALLTYALLELIDIAFLSIEPLFYASSIPFGGLGLPPPTIGLLLGMYGLLMGTFQVFCFAQFHAWLGSKRLLMLALSANIPIFMLFPMINLLARTYGLSLVTWIALCFQFSLSIFSDMSGRCAFIFVTLSAPNRRSLGATNGLVAAVTAALRTIGPAATTSLFAASIEHNLFNGLLVYIVLIGAVVFALFAASLLPASEEEWSFGDRVVPTSDV